MIELNKRSLNPQDPSLTWEEVNENWHIIEDYLNNHVSVAGPQGPQGEQGVQGYRGYQGFKGDTGETGSQGATFTPLVDSNGLLTWICDNPFILPPPSVNISGPQGATGEQGEAGDNPYTLVVTGSGFIKNNTGEVTLTPHLFQAGQELATIPSGLCLCWYNGDTLLSSIASETAIADCSWTVAAADVDSSITITCKLETL